ncbi:hypothetical protein YC2023_071403 [Brassica napus]
MALYAIRKKFRFRNIRSAPNGMVLRCFSSNCQWRVYATKLKDSDVYEIRKLDPIHTCSVDDRSGYQSQVTHHVVGEMMKARFNVMEILAVNFESSAGFEVKKIKHLEYEVRNKEGCSFHVDISKRFCSCFEFQLLEISCQHAIAAAIVAKLAIYKVKMRRAIFTSKCTNRSYMHYENHFME